MGDSKKPGFPGFFAVSSPREWASFRQVTQTSAEATIRLTGAAESRAYENSVKSQLPARKTPWRPLSLPCDPVMLMLHRRIILEMLHRSMYIVLQETG
ncbi:hypothetical protein [Paracoccus sp. IB05]|uniref:hypothetical protein n=1 Tax=Paracoccus sp. IB05 TaxID=2779367 RepID=UPI0018E8F19C|nr:hypothetical protein [Paracoccus sp. IB05]MBJ2151548.1 hypothetical protein [Paracoccus sp. IB05]